MAHCTPELRGLWEEALRERGAWTEPKPEDGPPIADPLAESIHIPVGRLDTKGYGPEEEEDE